MINRISLGEALTRLMQDFKSSLMRVSEMPESWYEVALTKTDVYTCSKCNVSFGTLLEFKNHCKSTEHVLQLMKRVGEDFEQDEEPEDVESEDEENIQAVSPYLNVRCGMATFRFFQKIFFNYQDIKRMPSLLSKLEALNESPVLICLIRSGYVAMAVVEASNREITRSKCIKRYTTRRGQGHSQSKSDNAKGASHSAGATLRRHNELALIEEVGVLLRSWWFDITWCYGIFWIDTDFSRQCLFANGVCEFGRSDPRFHTIPFTTGRPNLEEVRRCIDMLFTIEVIPIDNEDQKA